MSRSDLSIDDFEVDTTAAAAVAAASLSECTIRARRYAYLTRSAVLDGDTEDAKRYALASRAYSERAEMFVARAEGLLSVEPPQVDGLLASKAGR